MDDDLHPLLQRQMKRLSLDEETPPPDRSAWAAFLRRISSAYTQSDQDRYLLERSLTLASEEMQEEIEQRTAAQEELQQAHDHLEETVDERTIELQQLARELSQQTAILNAVLESMSEGIIVASDRWEFIVFNQAAHQILGVGPPTGSLKGWAEHCGIYSAENPTMLIDWKQLPLIRAIQGETCEQELLIRPKDAGQDTIVQSNAHPLEVENLIKGGVTILRDVTTQRHAEEALRDSEERYQTLFESAPDAYYLSDLKGAFLDGNKTAENMIGYRREELAGKSFLKLNLLPLAQIPKAAKLLALNALGRATGPDEFTLNRKDGDQLEVEITTTPITLNGKNVVLGIARDITRRKLAEHDLFFKNALLEAQSEASIDGILVTDETGHVISFNEKLREILSLPEDVWQSNNGRYLLSSVRPLLNDADDFIKKVEYLYQHKASKRRDEIALCDGRFFDWYSAPLIDTLGTYRGRIWYFRDITAQKTIEISLREAKEAAEEANRVKTEFLAVMSHELRTPLNAILGQTGLLLMGIKGELTDMMRSSLVDVQESGKQLLALIDDILDIAKVEAGKIQIVSEPILLPALVETWHTRSQVLAAKKGLAVHVDIDPDMPSQILGDQNRLSQIADNLLYNAIKFTPKGTIMLKVLMSADQQTWSIQVIDTGVGLSPEEMKYIFDDFRQVDSSSTRDYEGAGLGLAIVKRLVTHMQGTVTVESTAGEGSTFTVTLPLMLVPAQ